jgi:endonuclease/exonuclease/phosphatase (EEP) superfamily protein YafD
MTKQVKYVCLTAIFALVLNIAAVSQNDSPQRIRVASYNIKFLDTNVVTQGDRLEKLREVIRRLDAQVIGLQEIADRQAMELVFPPAEWSLVIDDDSRDKQDVALAVRKPLRVAGVGADLDADDANFLFPAPADHSAFPNRRDVLAVEVRLPDRREGFFVMVVHAKSRAGGRATTDPRRTEAARKLVEKLKADFQGQSFILLGDFNDNPDDRSLNVLETGDPDAPASEEETDGPFLINLMEPLAAAGHVSHGRTSAHVVGERINTIDPGSRRRNFTHRNEDLNTGAILFDQILINAALRPRHIGCSTRVFDDEIAVRGDLQNVASDHLPVFADFVFGAEAPSSCEAPADDLAIVALLPNPVGVDAGREEVTLENRSAAPIDLAGWRLQDRAGDIYLLSGLIPAGGQLKLVMRSNTMPLGNNGDEVTLISPQGNAKPAVRYAASQASEGAIIPFLR